MSALFIFKILLLKDRLELAPARWGTESESVKLQMT